MSEKNISYMPTSGLSYDPLEEKYWDPDALNLEVERAYEICHGCRMCFKYCDTFPDLFKLLDEKHDGDVRKISKEESDGLMDSCFQCKLCEVQCPYTPRDGHEFALDFPKLVHRYQAQRFKTRKKTLGDNFVSEPDFAGKMARMSLGMANTMNRVSFHRVMMEKLFGIHRDKLLPDFASTTFSSWAESEGLVSEVSEKDDAVLFQTCFVENNDTQIGKDTLMVLEKNGCSVTCEKGLSCCGMPNWEHGDLEALREKAVNNVERLYDHAKSGKNILVINPTCSMMLRQEYTDLLEDEHKEKAKVVAEKVMSPAEFLWDRRKENPLKELGEKEQTTKVSYHAPCHLRAESVGFRGRDVVKKVSGNKIGLVMECCGHNGTYAMKKETYESSIKIGQKAFSEMKDNDAEVWLTDCPLAAIQFQQHAGKKAIHPMTYLAEKYRSEEDKNESE